MSPAAGSLQANSLDSASGALWRGQGLIFQSRLGARDEFFLAATAQNLWKLAKLIPIPALQWPFRLVHRTNVRDAWSDTMDAQVQFALRFTK
jgi:hypothetical protein